MAHIIRCTGKHYPGHKTARECTVNSAVSPAVDFRDASSVDPTAHPFSKTRLNLQATHKNLPRKATTDQNARRCKYSFLGIQ